MHYSIILYFFTINCFALDKKEQFAYLCFLKLYGLSIKYNFKIQIVYNIIQFIILLLYSEKFVNSLYKHYNLHIISLSIVNQYCTHVSQSTCFSCNREVYICLN